MRPFIRLPVRASSNTDRRAVAWSGLDTIFIIGFLIVVGAPERILSARACKPAGCMADAVSACFRLFAGNLLRAWGACFSTR